MRREPGPWFPESSMRDGGCGAVAACESCIYFASEAGKTDLYPYGTKEIDKDEYIRFAYEMKPYLCPRPNGIDTLEMFMEGFEGYLHDVGDTDLEMKPFHGEHTWQEAAEAIRGQIDHSCPIPYLLLKHKKPGTGRLCVALVHADRIQGDGRGLSGESRYIRGEQMAVS